MPRISFTIHNSAAAYLKWYAEHVLLEGSEHDAARHLLIRKIEKARGKNRKERPTDAELEDYVGFLKKK